MTLLALAKRLQSLSPIRLTDAEALAMAQGLLQDFLIQERAPKNTDPIMEHGPLLTIVGGRS